MIRTSTRLLLAITAFIMLGVMALATQVPVNADGGTGGFGTPGSDPKEPIEIIDTAFFDLSAKLELTLGPENTVYRWVDEVFPNTSLNCRTPGQAYTRDRIRGFTIWIQLVRKGRYARFIYKATRDGTVLFQCLPTGPGPNLTVKGAPFSEEFYQQRIIDAAQEPIQTEP